MLKKKLIPTPPPTLEIQARRPIELLPVLPVSPKRWRILWKTLSAMMAEMAKLDPKKQKQADPAQVGIKLRSLIEELGGVWVKVGQVFALRTDLFPLEFCNELSRLQDKAVGFPLDTVSQLITEEFGWDIQDLFEEFSETPIAAASLAQVHKARLRTHPKRWVAVKIQRPFAKENFDYDLKICRKLFGFLQKIGYKREFLWMEMFSQIERMIHDELDFRFEAAALRRMRKSLREHKIYVPRVYRRYSGKKVLIMEFIEGVLMSEFILIRREHPLYAESWLQANNVDEEKVARRLVHSLFRQIYEDNLFHADLHPGNIMLLRNSRIAFLDMGSIGSLTLETLANLQGSLLATMQRDYTAAANYSLRLAAPLPLVDLNPIKQELIEQMSDTESRYFVQGLPFHEKSISSGSERIQKVFAKYKLPPNWSMLKVGRTWASLDLTIGTLYPDINYNKVMADYMESAAERKRMQQSKRMVAQTEQMEAMNWLSQSAILAHSITFQPMTGKVARFLAFITSIILVAMVAGMLLIALNIADQVGLTVIHNISPEIRGLVDGIPDFHHSINILLVVAGVLGIMAVVRFIKGLLKPSSAEVR